MAGQPTWSSLPRYSLALVASLGALACSLALQPHIATTPFLLFLAAVAVSAWYGGLGPGLLATVVSGLAINYYFENPRGSFAIMSPLTMVELAIYALVALLISALSAHLRAAYRRADVAQRTAEEALRARDRFLSIAAHELRAPITSIAGYVDLLRRHHQRGTSTPEQVERHLAAIGESADRLARLTQELLDASQLRAEQFPLQPAPLDFVALVRELAERFRDRLDGRHRLTVALEPVARPVVADADRLAQVVTNLLENAAKYSPEGGEIRVTVRPEGAGVRLSVQDQGIGLPPGATEAIFEPFERAPNAVRQRLPGLGLGLFICRDIVTRHGGRLWAESAGEGQGATFSVWLPLEHRGVTT